MIMIVVMELMKESFAIRNIRPVHLKTLLVKTSSASESDTAAMGKMIAEITPMKLTVRKRMSHVQLENSNALMVNALTTNLYVIKFLIVQMTLMSQLIAMLMNVQRWKFINVDISV